MNHQQHHDIQSLLTHLSTLLSTQPLPTSTPSGNKSPPVLPPTIPPFPTSLQSLPPSPLPSPITDLTTLLQTHILPYLNASSLSPHYYGFVTGGATPVALLSDYLVSTYDQNCSVYLPSESIATTVEAAALNQLIQLFNLPETEWGIGKGGRGGGTITTGATASNVLGLALGREWVVMEAARRRRRSSAGGGTLKRAAVSVGELGFVQACMEAGVRGVEILSTMPHSSIAKAAAVVGIGRRAIVDVGCDGDPLRIDFEKFEGLARNMREEGKAYILAVSAGEVNTGKFATDGLEVFRKVRRVCDVYGIWMHVDGAFGLFGRVLMGVEGGGFEHVVKGVEGIELADSITGDGHKLLNVPYDCGLAFTRHKELSEAVFQNGNAAYLTSGIGAEEPLIQSPMNIGIENSRRFRALPVWATLTAYGRQGYIDMLQRQIGLARRVTEWMWNVDAFELLPKCASKEEAVRKTFMVVLFRARDQALNQGLVKKINGTGKIYVTGTKWDGLPAARIAISNWQVDVERDFGVIKEVLSGCLNK